MVSQTVPGITVSYPVSAFSESVTVQAINNCGSSVIRTSTVKLPVYPEGGARQSGIPITNTKTTHDENMQVRVSPNQSVSDFKLQVLTAWH